MLRSLATLALLIPLAFAPDATAATGTSHGKTSLTQSDGKRKKKTAKKHKKHRKHHKKTVKNSGGVRN